MVQCIHLTDEVAGDVARVERGGDYDLSLCNGRVSKLWALNIANKGAYIDDVLLEHAIWALLVACHLRSVA
jgi:hypothetical protein